MFMSRFLTCDCKVSWVSRWIRDYDLQVNNFCKVWRLHPPSKQGIRTVPDFKEDQGLRILCKKDYKVA